MLMVMLMVKLMAMFDGNVDGNVDGNADGNVEEESVHSTQTATERRPSTTIRVDNKSELLVPSI